MMNHKLVADVNFFKLSENQYPGRGIVVGLDETGKDLVQIYWIMGRSENSRNRVFEEDCRGRLFTEAADPSKVKDPSLIIYNAMRETRDSAGFSYAVVSNGNQTDGLAEGGMSSLVHYTYEPDAPNFTPRITACSFWRRSSGNPGATISILRKSPWSNACDRHLYEIGDIGRGFGYCITTYSGDGNPLPSFRGEPYLVPLVGNAAEIAETFWGALNVDNRVSLAVKVIPKNGSSMLAIINKFKRV